MKKSSRPEFVFELICLSQYSVGYNLHLQNNIFNFNDFTQSILRLNRFQIMFIQFQEILLDLVRILPSGSFDKFKI